MDKDRMVRFGEVEAAFETLLEVIGRECDARTAETVYWAREDVLSILAGEWPGVVEECAGEETAGEEEDRIYRIDRMDGVDGVDGERCPACHQSLGDIGQIKFACPTCYETFGDEAVEAAVRPF